MTDSVQGHFEKHRFLGLSKNFPNCMDPESFVTFFTFLFIFINFLSLPREQGRNISPSSEENKFIPHNSVSHIKKISF